MLHRWRLRPGHEERFKEAWSVLNKALNEGGSPRSRLHVGNDGLWYSFTQLPGDEARTGVFDADDAQRTIDEAVLESFPEIVLTPCGDHLVSKPAATRMRVARPTKDIERSITFWAQVVGFELLSRFSDHEGYGGAILGNAYGQWELEVTHHSSGLPLPTPTDEDIIALYLHRDLADEVIKRLILAGHLQKRHPNPYWQAMGASVHTDPDGYTLIIYPED
ncbi:MAG: hypothetical protein RLZ37_2167 [Actinomycetota bacterium]